ncbi:MAG: SRPBCC family protein [Solirubrobacterales bacterium]
MAWQMEHSAETEAEPAAVWKRYTDVENWSEWSPKGVEESSLEGDFEVGAKGHSKAPHLPKGRFELVVVEPERCFVSKSSLPGASITFEHAIEPSGDGTRITHTATIDGPLARLWTPLVGRIIGRGLPTGVERLAEVAKKKEVEAREEAKEEERHEKRLEEADAKFKEEIEKTAHGEDRGGASVPGS